ncbi:MAG: ParB/RepB/Spo0J family partition protein [Candidatus Omnitrophota bacterium]
MERKALGRGLGALIPEKSLHKTDKIIYVKTQDIKSSKFQPRENFDSGKEKELAASIREKGVVQPILVRPKDGSYELIAGERRLRAVRSLSAQEIPAIVREVNDIEAFELALIENIQREELNAIEEANAYKRLMQEFEFTLERIAAAVGKDKTTVANTMRLLRLPEKIQREIIQGNITMGHARALVAIEDVREQIALCEKILEKNLSVREIEHIASAKRKKSKKRHTDPHVQEIEDKLRKRYGTKVNIIHGKKRGRIEFEYYSHQDLNRLVNLLTK